MIKRPVRIFLATVMLLGSAVVVAAQGLSGLKRDFPKTDFERHSVPFAQLQFDGATRDSIPPITDPQYKQVAEIEDIEEFEPVLSIILNGDARAYPLRIMLWHEIVNDLVGGIPVLISYCPLCNSGVIFDRRVNGRTLSFGNTGRIRNYDMVMYDHQSESFWQQYTGEAIVGALTETLLTPLPARLESLAAFEARAPQGLVLVPENKHARPYGTTPYAGMDTRDAPRLVREFNVPSPLGAMDYVVAIGNRAWPVFVIREKGKVEEAGLTIRWTPGRNSLHDDRKIRRGRDLGNITVQDPSGADIPHDVVFAFAFAAFRPDGEWMSGEGE